MLLNFNLELAAGGAGCCFCGDNGAQNTSDCRVVAPPGDAAPLPESEPRDEDGLSAALAPGAPLYIILPAAGLFAPPPGPPKGLIPPPPRLTGPPA